MTHLFFDLDNTLWDFRKNSEITIEELFNKNKLNEIYSIQFNDFYKTFHDINEQLWVEFRDHKITKEELRLKRFSETFKTFNINDKELPIFFENNYLDEVINHNFLVDGVEETLIYLKNKNYIMHVVSNGFTEITNRKVKNSNLKNYIQTISSAEEINKRKPNPEIFQFSLDKSNAKLENSIFIGDDWVADVCGAIQFGFKTFFFNPLNEKHSHNFQSLIEFQDFKELKNIL